MIDSEIDWLKVLRRLVAYATKHITIGSDHVANGELVIRGLGLSIEDIATEVWERALVDSQADESRRFTSEDDAVTTLIPRLYHRFLDRTRRQDSGRPMMVWERERGLPSHQESAAPDDPAASVSWHQFCALLLADASALRNPKVTRYIELQYQPEGFMGYTRAEAARLLGTTPDEITNIQKAMQRLLSKYRLLT